MRADDSANQGGREREKQYTVDYEIQEAAEDVRMSKKELQKFLKTSGGGRLDKDEGEFEDDYASDQLDFLRKTVISWKPLRLLTKHETAAQLMPAEEV